MKTGKLVGDGNVIVNFHGASVIIAVAKDGKMKVVLFCGGLGSRLREHSETVPKPLVNIGPRPIIWHLMRYYAHLGHKEFILCLGYKGDMIKDYFLNYDDCRSNDFSISGADRKIELLDKDIDDWKITFVDTGMHANLGERLKAVEKYVAGEEMFLANYSDGLSDLPLNSNIARFRQSDAIAGFVSVRPFQTYHVVESDADERVTGIVSVTESDVWVNGGFFVLRPQIFEYMRDGEELVVEPFQRLIAEDKLMTWKYYGFWEAMDTFKDWKNLEDMYQAGQRPWDLQSLERKKLAAQQPNLVALESAGRHAAPVRSRAVAGSQ